MPSLIAFGRRWNISSDDFVFPELTEAIVRLGWVLITALLFIFHSPLACPAWRWLPYIGAMVVINMLGAALAFVTASLSARGTILDMRARRHVVTMLYIRFPLLLIELGWTVISTLIIFNLLGVKDWCPGYFMHALRICVLLEWCLIIAILFGVFLVFNPQGGHSTDTPLAVERRYWQSKLRPCKLRQPDHVQTALDEIAHLIASFFAETDFVFSDIVAGLLLLVHSPQPPDIPRSSQASSHQYLGNTAEISNVSNTPEWMRFPSCLPMIARMLDFTVAIYGWPSYMLNNCGCMPWMRLWRRLGCCAKSSNSKIVTVGDNCCSCHTGAFVVDLGEAVELNFISFQNHLYQVPFIVLVDHDSRSIVITIRGSASLFDLITDLSLNEDTFSVDVDTDPVLVEDKELDGRGQVRVHRGMLRAARCVYDTLREQRVIETQIALYPAYKLVVCGHSLGAGIASLLTLLLRQSGYPQVRCYAFSPPGCVISEHGLAETESCVLSVVVGDDFVTRMSYQSLRALKTRVDREIYSTNKAKYEILTKGIFKLFFHAPWELHDTVTSTATNHGDAAGSGVETTRDNRRLLCDLESPASPVAEYGTYISIPPQQHQQRIQLRPPGRILQLKARSSNSNQPTPVRARWVDYNYLSEIRLTASMFTDHFPYRVQKVVRRAWEEALPV